MISHNRVRTKNISCIRMALVFSVLSLRSRYGLHASRGCQHPDCPKVRSTYILSGNLWRSDMTSSDCQLWRRHSTSAPILHASQITKPYIRSRKVIQILRNQRRKYGLHLHLTESVDLVCAGYVNMDLALPPLQNKQAQPFRMRSKPCRTRPQNQLTVHTTTRSRQHQCSAAPRRQCRCRGQCRRRRRSRWRWRWWRRRQRGRRR